MNCPRTRRCAQSVRARKVDVLVRIEAPHFVAGVVPGVAAAPIVRYIRAWSPARIRAYCHRQKWRCCALR